MAHNVTETPMIKQYQEMKAKHPDVILLFRIGDFYETWSDDAIACSEILGITLTRRYNGKEKAIELAGFPHHALDTYLPKLVRAGKRVAICEQLKDGKQRVAEQAIPATTSKTTEEPKQEPKTPKKMKTDEIKRKDTILENVKYLDDEPIAWFTLNIPKDAKDCGKCTEKDGLRPVLNAIMVEPDSGKMVVTNTRILHAYDVKCKGVWPQDRTTPFQCYIEPKDVARLAGKEIDVAVFAVEINGRKSELTMCEVVGTRSECDYKGIYPDWRRVMPQNIPDYVKLTQESVEELRKWLKPLIGKTKKERENTQITIKANKESGKLDVRVIARSEKYGEITSANEDAFALDDFNSDTMVCYNAELFYYAILPDFYGNICISDCRANKFCGKMRETILMPIQITE